MARVRAARENSCEERVSAVQCDGARTGGPRSRSSVPRRGAKAAGWVLPSAVMVLMPKCPMCVVAYVAIVTGRGFRFLAAHLRLLVLVFV